MARIAKTVAAMTVLVVVAGCPSGDSKEGVHLQGKVTIGGQPISNGNGVQASIMFSPTSTDQLNPAGAEIVNGMYDVKNAPKGKVKVTFLVLKEGPAKSFDGVARPQPTQTSLVPDDKAAGFEVQVDSDKSDLNFEL